MIQSGAFYCKGLGDIKFTIEHVVVDKESGKTQGYISFEESDPRIEISYNLLRYLSLFIDSMSRYYKRSKIVKLGTVEIIKDSAPRNLKLYKISGMRIR